MDGSFGRTLVWIAAILGAIGLLLYLFVFDTWVVPGDDPLFTAAIAPTLSPEDRILTLRGSTPNRGQLARCLMPDGSGKFIIGRVVAVGGEDVTIENERVIVGGTVIKTRFNCGVVTVMHPVSTEPVTLTCNVEDNGSFTYSVLVAPEQREPTRSAKVEPGKIYLVSDNRHIHLDSRDFGSVDPATCEHVVYRLWGQSFSDGSHRFTLLW